MPSLRIYFDVVFDFDFNTLEEKLNNDENFAVFDENDTIIKAGFFKFKDNKIFRAFSDSGYYAANYIMIGTKKIASKNSELSYFKLLEREEDYIEFSYPIMIKLFFNKSKKILCFYSKKLIKNEEANDFLETLSLKYGYKFLFNLKNTHFRLNRNELDDFIKSLDITNYRVIAIDDQDNEIIAKNSDNIRETEKVISILEEKESGNWSYMRLYNPFLDFEISISNRRSQNYISFHSQYKNDVHLYKVIDYLIEKIQESFILNKKTQSSLDYYVKAINLGKDKRI